MDPIASDLARANMIEQQIRPCEVLDDRVLDAMNSIPREEFVAAEYVDWLSLILTCRFKMASL